MNKWGDVDRALRAWLAAEAPRTAPDGLLGPVLAATSGSGPLPTWRALLSVPAMRTPSSVLVGSLAVRTVPLVLVLILVGLVAAAVIVGAGARRPDRDAAPPATVEQGSTEAPPYRLTLGALGSVYWDGGPDPDAPGDHYVAWRTRYRGLAPDTFIGDLTVEVPARVHVPLDTIDSGSRGWLPAPPDMVRWLVEHPLLDVLDVAPAKLGGRDATAIDALPVRPPGTEPGSLESHFATFLPVLTLDYAWQYRFVVVDLEDAGWLVATCGAGREDWSNVAWSEAVRACDQLLATWRFMDP